MMMDCDICEEPVYLSKARYRELRRLGEQPRCRKNGCERLVGSKTKGVARVPEVIAEIDVPPLTVLWPRKKKGNRNGALAKLRARPNRSWTCADGGAADK